MVIDPVPSDGPATRIAIRGYGPPMAVLAAALAMAALGGHLSPPARVPGVALEGQVVLAERPTLSEMAPPEEAAPQPGLEPWRSATGGPLSRWAWTVEPPASPAEEAAPSAAPRLAEPPRTAMTVPLPVPRPPELGRPGGSASARRAERQARRNQPMALPPQAKEDDRSFFEKLFGIERAPALAYAALERRPTDIVPRQRLNPSIAPPIGASPSGGTAVYNIVARTVTLPNGERLEAHSGLGETMDDPRQVHVRMRGPTPPGTYDLSEREQAFHGVRAIRLTPVGGSDVIYGRVGLLAHTYMLGPTGASNGCVSFRDYDRFLQAYLKGEIQRLVVVSGTQDALPSLADGGAGIRLARNGS